MSELFDANGRITPRCVVCRTELPPDPHLCPRCETPHHRDCWDYNGGCAVFGCSVAQARTPPRPQLPPWQVRERALGMLFGAALGCGALGTLLGMLPGWQIPDPETGMAVGACAALTGALTGGVLRSTRDRGFILLCGLFGPGLGAWLALVVGTMSAAPAQVPMMLAALIPMLLFGVVMSPVAIPCAWIIARFNDPEKMTRARRRGWLVLAGLLLCSALRSALQTSFR